MLIEFKVGGNKNARHERLKSIPSFLVNDMEPLPIQRSRPPGV